MELIGKRVQVIATGEVGDCTNFGTLVGDEAVDVYNVVIDGKNKGYRPEEIREVA